MKNTEEMIEVCLCGGDLKGTNAGHGDVLTICEECQAVEGETKEITVTEYENR